MLQKLWQPCLSAVQGGQANVGSGLSGHAGEGPLCRNDRATASSLQDSLNAGQAQLTTAQGTVTTLNPQVASARLVAHTRTLGASPQRAGNTRPGRRLTVSAAASRRQAAISGW